MCGYQGIGGKDKLGDWIHNNTVYIIDNSKNLL